MSNIFDALQKSVAEYAGSDALRNAEAIELLRNAESRAATTWDSRAKARPSAEGSQGAAVVAAVSVMGTADVFDEMRLLNVSPPKDNRLVTLTQAESSAAEAFRLLSVRLRHLQRELAIKKLLITSTIPQEGKSVVSANLACTLALKGEQKVLLLEGDLRRPTLMRSFGLSGNPGLCECFQDGRPLGTCIYQLKDTGIWILPAGQVTNSAPNLLQSEWLSPIMDRLNVWFDWIIIDSPPVLPLADTSVWARLADGIILVTRQGVTEKRDLRTGLEGLDRQKLIGAVLNCSRNATHSDYYYGSPTPAERDSERD